MTMAATVAHAAAATGRRAGERPDGEGRHRHALPVDAEAVLRAAGALRREAGIHVLQPEVDEGRPAGDDLAARVDEGVGENGDRLHAELEAFVEVGAVQHPAPHVLAYTQV